MWHARPAHRCLQGLHAGCGGRNRCAFQLSRLLISMEHAVHEVLT